MISTDSQLGSVLRAEENKLLACIHCGLCLEACPTYFHTGDENDSPRGRIYLMRAVEEGRLDALSPSFGKHINRCLGCRACEQACPAGVEYGQLLEAARADNVARRRAATWIDQLLGLVLRHIWLQPMRLRLAFAAARLMRDLKIPALLLKTGLPQRLAPRFGFSLALLDGSRAAAQTSQRMRPQEAATPGSLRARALLFTGCVMEGLFARVNRATARVLTINECAVSTPPTQVCCGALHAHAGDLDGARSLARRNLRAFEDEEGAPVVTNAGGCGAMLKSYGHLLSDDPEYARAATEFSARVRDVSQQLEMTGVRKGEQAGDLPTTYDASCHLLYGQGARRAPLEMLRGAKGLNFVPLEGSEVCCGGAGIYNLLQPEMSARVLGEKLKHIDETGAAVLATGNPGCHMQIAAGARLSGKTLRVCHPVEILDEAYANAGLYEKKD